jgi:hypothetical protein
VTPSNAAASALPPSRNSERSFMLVPYARASSAPPEPVAPFECYAYQNL